MAAVEGPIAPIALPPGPIEAVSVPAPSEQHKATVTDRLTFPPFPQPPLGISVVPFSEYIECGIRLEPGANDAEVDAFGIVTMSLKHRHPDTDACKTNTKRKRVADEEKARKVAGEKSRKKDWWEMWEERAESQKYCSVDSSWPAAERLQAAAVDFTKDHFWPPQTQTQTGPRYIWDKFLAFIGLPAGGEATLGKMAMKRAADEAIHSDEDDDDMSDDGELVVEIDENEPRIVEVPMDEPIRDATKRKLDSDEARLEFFLEDPETCVKVFMSSHAWQKGFVWSEPNLPIMPRMLGYWVNYLLRNNVLKESTVELRAASTIIAVALLELPQSAALMKIIPDKFGKGCKACYGQKAEGYKVADVEFGDAPVPAEPKKEEPKANAGRWGDVNSGWGSGGGWGGADAAESSDGLGLGSGWQAIVEEVPDAKSAASADSWTLNTPDWLLKAKEQPHFALFGPTTFPLTHRSAVVERSMRRIKSISPPNPNPPISAPAEGPEAGAVEIELDAQLCKLVLSPMIDWDGGEAPVYSRPTILESSEGPVVEEGAPSAGPSASGSPKPHDPLNDEITLLLGVEQANLLREGMGLGGTFVQLVRRDGQGKKKKKGKSKKPPVYWYLEEAAFVAVSYWAFTS